MAAWLAAGAALLLASADLGFAIHDGAPPGARPFAFPGAFGLVGAGFAAVGAVIAIRRPHNPVGWLCLVSGVAAASAGLAQEYAGHTLLAAPGSLTGGRVAAWVASWAWVPSVAPVATLLPLLFPTGRPPSLRWRPLAWAAVIDAVVLTVGTAVVSSRLPDGVLVTFSPDTLPATLANVAAFYAPFSVLVVVAGACAASLVVRLRRSSGEERRQVEWLAYAIGAWVLVLVIMMLALAAGAYGPVLAVVTMVGFLAIPATAALAMLRRHLFDVRVVITRAMTYGSLAAFVTTVYVAVVVGLGAAIGAQRQGRLGLSVIATTAVAFGFEPLRRRAQLVADRLVYGHRSSPYELLSELAARMAGAYALDEVLPHTTRVVGEGIGAAAVAVWLRVADQLHLAASWPEGAPPDASRIPVAAIDEQASDPGTRWVPVSHQGDPLGFLVVRKPQGERFSAAESDLLADLASQAGLVVSTVRLTAELEERVQLITAQAAELGASRQRLVAAQEEERRRLQRDIHDGAQQSLVALMTQLRLTERLVGRDQVRAAAVLRESLEAAAQILADLRDLASGVCPPLLVDEGLGPALAAQARRSAIPVIVEATGLGRYSSDVEAAVYFASLEALQNATKHASAGHVLIDVRQENARLVFSVTDDGRGFDVAHAPPGHGLANMTDRVAAVGGRLEILSEAGHGTVVSGVVGVPGCVTLRTIPPTEAVADGVIGNSDSEQRRE